MDLNELIENELNEKIPPGSLIKGTVTIHTGFGIFLDIGMNNAIGLIEIISFVDEGRMWYDQYPRLGTQIEAVVMGVRVNDRSDHQFYLSLKPSLLKEAYQRLSQGETKRIDFGSKRKRIIEKFPIGILLKGSVSWLTPFNVIVNFSQCDITGEIAFTEFLDEGEMDYDFYPLPNTKIEAVVIGYTDDDRLKLSAKPSLLKKAIEEEVR